MENTNVTENSTWKELDMHGWKILKVAEVKATTKEQAVEK